MDEHTQRLGELLQAAREARRPRLTQPQAAELLGVGRSTIQNIEAGKFSKVTATIRAYAKLFGWPDGAAERVAAGAPSPEGGAESTEPLPQDATPLPLPLPPAVEYELRTAETLETVVINLGPREEDGHVIVVLQGRKGAAPEEVARIAARFRSTRRYLQSLAGESDSDEVADS